MYHLRFLLLMFFLPFLIFTTSYHPVYVSNAEVSFDKSEKRIEIAIKIFSDDLAKTLSNVHSKSIEIDTDREDKDADDYIANYIKDNFIIELNNKTYDMKYLNRKKAKDDFYAIWVLFVVPNVKRIKNFNIKNTLLLDQFDAQRNFISYLDADKNFHKYSTFKNNINAKLH